MPQRPLPVVVVGGGLAGLSAAIVAARAGALVTVLERASEPGGRAITTRKDGYLLNLGPHALYHKAETILGSLGITVSGNHPPLDRTIAWRNGQSYRLPLGGDMLSTDLLNAADKLEAENIFASIGALETGVLQSVTLSDWLDRTVHSQRVRTLLETLFRVSSYANAPTLASAGAHLDHLRATSRRSVRYIHGGWQTIVNSLRARAVASGVLIQTGTPVSRVLHDGVRWRVRTTAVGEIDADAVILAVSPREASRIVDGPGSDSLARWANQAVPVQAATLDVALSKVPRAEDNYSIGIDRPLYFSLHSVAARLSPEGGGVFHAAMYLPPDGRPDSSDVLSELDWLVDEVQPGWRDFVVHRRYLPHITVTNAFVTAAQGGLPGRPGPVVPDGDGLFVAGDWVGPVGMLTEAALSSGVAAGGLAARMRAREEEAVVS